MAGRQQAYAVTSDTRLALAPDIPTFAEMGLPALSCERALDVSEEDELYPESPIAASERVQQFRTIKEVLTASELGTS
jgi:hypothetical protein